jgi:hypothetical protein
MPTHALLVHGYSEQSLNSYGKFPEALADTAPELKDTIVLSAFESLDDGVTIDDLADGLELQMRELEKTGWNTADAVVFAHSTGALVARRWIVKRLGTAALLPTHFITMAGANHGSTLAQLGRTSLGYAHQHLLKNSAGVGAGVLTDLDYGSDFLLKLNREWLEWRYGDRAAQDDRLQKMFLFSMGGDQLGPDKATRLLWASAERGCDNTVRISGANLNYTFLIADADQGVLAPLPRGFEPHIIIPKHSHYGDADGIMASNTSKDDAPMVAIRAALDVPAKRTVESVRTDWDAANAAWAAAPAVDDRDDKEAAGKTNAQVHQNSTLVLYLHDRAGRSIAESFIGLLEAGDPDLDADRPEVQRNALVAALLKIGGTIEPRSPIHNDVQRGSYSFYVNTDAFNKVHHRVTIDAHSPGSCVAYKPVFYETDPASPLRLVRPNECTYVDVTVGRDPIGSYALYKREGRVQDAEAWRPFPPGQLCPPKLQRAAEG